MRASACLTWLASIALVVAAVGACSSFSDSNDAPAPTGDAGPDVSTSADATNEVRADDAGADSTSPDASVINLVENGDFESTCAGVKVYLGSVTSEPIGHESAQSCRICSTSTSGYTAFVNTPNVAVRGAQYEAKAFVRAVPQGSAPQTTIKLSAFGSDPNTPLIDGQESTGPQLDDTWRAIGALVTVPPSPDTAPLRIELAINSGDAQTCFLLDDVVIFKKQ